MVHFSILSLQNSFTKYLKMKKLLFTLLLLFPLFSFSQDIIGKWKTIDDEDGTPSTLFVAVRTGKTVKIANLTTDPINEKNSDLKTVREALKQAKNFNEDIIFETAVISDRLSIHKYN